jgi:hypothetical protein
MFSGPHYGPSSSLSNDATAAQDRANTMARAVQEMSRGTDDRVDQLVLVCAALWELMRERSGLTEADLITRIAEIDARDGVADGRITKKTRTCPACAHIVFPRHKKCLFCGADLPADSVFKTI